MKDIFITQIPKKMQDYDTVGNYSDKGKILVIEVSKMKGYVNNEDELLGVAIHELVEMLLCKKRGISFKRITDWDIAHENVDSEPGEIKGAPYFSEHAFANKIEKMFVEELKKSKL